MKAKCLIEAEFPDTESREAALAAISHEGDVGNRSVTRISGSGSSLRLEIEAEDVVALRATANACLRALQVFEGLENDESEVRK
jgi:tRNA threonylcarbamoyladenosine modification (KEOPS) complex  Pcc1 subunit